ncbi:MAG: AAA family ATPase [Planctomycetes bacterium]|nr:AAA family ATPase [Planctomycetota bacterium]
MARWRSKPGPYVQWIELLRERIASFDEYPFCIPAVRHLEKLVLHPQVTFLVGENGTGKSTLLEAFAVASGMNAEGGSRNLQFSTHASHSALCESLRIARTTAGSPGDTYFLRAESFYNVATEIERIGMLIPYGGQSLHEQSHGESFFTLFEVRFGKHGLYLMDEPEAALSVSRQLQFLSLLNSYCRRGCQFVIATHSPIIMAFPHATIYEFSPVGIREIKYQESEQYRVTRGFLEHPERSLEILLADDEHDLPEEE